LKLIEPLVLAALPVLLASLGCEEAPVEDAPSVTSESRDVIALSAELVANGGFLSVPVEERDLAETLEVPGRLALDEDRTSRVGSPAEGRVSRILVSLGDDVREGAPLLEIHSHELIVARSDYVKAKASLSAAERKLAYAETELARSNRLLAAKALSERERLMAASDLVAAEAEVERARSELSRAEHYLAHLGVTAEDTSPEGDLVIRAPLSGRVLERHVTLGAVVNPADDLIVLSDLRTLWVVGELPERQAALVEVGQRVDVELTAFPGERLAAEVFHVGERLDPELRTVVVRCSLPNPDGRLLPEMYASLHLHRGEDRSFLAVPEAAVQRIDDRSVVFIDLGDGRFERRFVEEGRHTDGWTEVLDGLSAGEKVVTDGSFLVKSEFLKARFEEE
jgi:cobalt-zinc-cadmium efflux system membrane fusion protein